MYKLSVIIPVYNNENYLIQCLGSVVNQSLRELEIIIVDDGSTDSSGKICDEYAQKDNRIKVIHQENSGLGRAYNVGLKAARGEYIGFIESDDYAELDMYENLYALAHDFDADIVKSDWYSYKSMINQSEQKHILDKYPEKTNINVKTYPDLLLVQASIWSAIYKKTFLQKFGIKFIETSGASYQDLSFTFKTISSAEKIIITKKPYIHYRTDNENSSIHSKKKVYAVCGEFKEFENYIKKYPEIGEYIEDYKWIIQYYVYKWNLERLSEKYKSNFYKVFRKTFSQALDKKQLKNKFFDNVSKKEFLSIIGRKDIITYSSFFEKLFSIKNVVIDKKKYKLITLCGIKIKIKRKNCYTENIKIFIAYHRPEKLLQSKICIPINVGRTLNQQKDICKLTKEEVAWLEENMSGDDTGDNISYLNRQLNEITGIYWVWKHYEQIGNPEIIGFVHYRTLLMLNIYPQYFENYLDCLGYTVPFINYLLKNKKAITGEWVEANTINPKKTKMFDWTRSCKSIYESYKYIKYGHNVMFYDGLLEIIRTKFKNEYKDFYNWSTKPYRGGPFKNLFITRKEEFFKYCEWLFPIVFEMVEKFKDYEYKDPLEIRNLSWTTELLTAYYFDKYIGKYNCRRIRAFRLL